MMKIIVVIGVFLCLLSCSGSKATLAPSAQADVLPKAMLALSWIKDANSRTDANAAIANNDYRLMAINLRGAVYPGVDAADLDKVKRHCKHRFLEGMGDTIMSQAHRDLMNQGKQYARKYNEIMVVYCLANAGQ